MTITHSLLTNFFFLTQNNCVKYKGIQIIKLPEWTWFIQTLEIYIKNQIRTIIQNLSICWKDMEDEQINVDHELDPEAKQLYEQLVEIRKKRLNKGIKIYLSLPRAQVYYSFSQFYRLKEVKIFEYVYKYLQSELSV